MNCYSGNGRREVQEHEGGLTIAVINAIVRLPLISRNKCYIFLLFTILHFWALFLDIHNE